MPFSDKTLNRIWGLLIKAAPVPANLAGALSQTIDDATEADETLADHEIAKAIDILAAFWATADDTKEEALANFKRSAAALEKLIEQMYEIRDEVEGVYDA